MARKSLLTKIGANRYIRKSAVFADVKAKMIFSSSFIAGTNRIFTKLRKGWSASTNGLLEASDLPFSTNGEPIVYGWIKKKEKEIKCQKISFMILRQPRRVKSF